MTNFYHLIARNLRIMGFLWESSPVASLFLTFVQVVKGLVPVIQVWVFAKLVDVLTHQVSFIKHAHEGLLEALIPLAPWLLSIVGLLILGDLLNGYTPYLIEHLKLKSQGIIDIRLLRLSSQVSLELMDQAEFHDITDRAVKAGSQSIVRYYQKILTAGSSLVTMISLLVYLASAFWFLRFIILTFLIPLFYYQISAAKQRHKIFNRQTEEHRKADYLAELFLDRQAGKEIRIFSLKNYLIDQWRSLILKADHEILLKERNQIALTSLWEFITNLVYVTCQGGVIIAFGLGHVSAGLTASLFMVIQQLQSAATSLERSVMEIMDSLRDIKAIFLFLDYEKHLKVKKQVDTLPDKEQEGITCKNLSFSYPGQTTETLHSININIKPGEKIALVGENGSGKTTLAKLILGLYEPTNGQVLNSINQQSTRKEDYFQRMSAIFQDFGQYELSLRENVGFSDLVALNDDGKLEEVLKEVDIQDMIHLLPQGLDTVLGTSFEYSHNLSGGQWQKIAAARALLRESDLLVLDEPTAALDPKAEVDILTKIMNHLNGRSVILISHRIGCARLADRIIVLDQGRILEEGTHRELMEKKGKYAQFFELQAHLYH